MPFELPESLTQRTILCEHCGVKLLADTKNQKFCSSECRLANFYAHKITVCCPACKVDFKAGDNLTKLPSRNYSELKG